MSKRNHEPTKASGRDTIELVFLPPDGGWMDKSRRILKRRYAAYEARAGRYCIRWKDGEIWEMTPIHPGRTIRRIDCMAPDQIEVGPHDPKGLKKIISATLQFIYPPDTAITTLAPFKCDLIGRTDKALLEKHLCTLDIYAAPSEPAAPISNTEPKPGSPKQNLKALFARERLSTTSAKAAWLAVAKRVKTAAEAQRGRPCPHIDYLSDRQLSALHRELLQKTPPDFMKRLAERLRKTAKR